MYDLVAYTDQRHFRGTTPAMDNPTLLLPGLSPVSGKRLDVRFDGGMLSSDGGILLLREVETIRLAHRPVRHLAPAPHQDRRPRHRVEDLDPRPVANGMS